MKEQPGAKAERQNEPHRQPGQAHERENRRGNRGSAQARSGDGVNDARTRGVNAARTKMAGSLAAAFDRLRKAAEAHDGEVPGSLGPHK